MPLKKVNVFRISEHEEQKAFMEWVKIHETTYPGIDHMFAVPNGGKRSFSVAKKLKAEGVKRGVPDLFLPVPKGLFCGLWIEMKAKDGKLSADQILWRDFLTAKSYAWKVCYGCNEAIKTVQWYWNQ